MSDRELTGAEQKLLDFLEVNYTRELVSEATHAFLKHGYRRTPAARAGGSYEFEKLAILVEEVGEVAKALTYDQDGGELRGELIQVATMALLWMVSIDYPTAPVIDLG